MSDEQLNAFLKKAKENTKLQQEIEAAPNLEAVVSIAKNAGFSIELDELKNSAFETSSDLSEEELEGVAGGKVCVMAGTKGGGRGDICIMAATEGGEGGRGRRR